MREKKDAVSDYAKIRQGYVSLWKNIHKYDSGR